MVLGKLLVPGQNQPTNSSSLIAQDSGQYSIDTEEASNLQLKLSIKRLT